MQSFKQHTPQNQNYKNYSQDAFQMNDQQRQKLEQNIIKEDRQQQQTKSLISQDKGDQKFNFQGPNSTYQGSPNIQNQSEVQYGDESQVQRLMDYYRNLQERNDNEQNEPDEEYSEGYDENAEYDDNHKDYYGEEQEQQEEQDQEEEQFEEYEQQGEDDQNDSYNNLSQSQEQEQDFNLKFSVNAISSFQPMKNQNAQNSIGKYTYEDQPINHQQIKYAPKIEESKNNFTPNLKLQRQELKVAKQEDCDNDFLIKMRIQEQMKKYDQSKQTQQTQDEQNKNVVKQQVWEQLFNNKQKDISAITQKSQKIEQIQKIQQKQKPSSNELQQQVREEVMNQQSLIKNLDQTKSQVQQNPSHNQTNQYINNFIMNSMTNTQKISSTTINKGGDEEQKKQSNLYGKNSKVFEKQLQESNLIKQNNFQDKFQSQLFQLPQKILNNQVSIEYQDNYDQNNSQVSNSTFGKSKAKTTKPTNDQIFEPTFDPQQFQNGPHTSQLNQFNQSRKSNTHQENYSELLTKEEQMQKSIIELAKQDFSTTQKFDDKFFESMKPINHSVKLYQNSDIPQESDDDMEDLNNRQSDVFIEELKGYSNNGVKTLHLIQEVEESQIKVDNSYRKQKDIKQFQKDDYSQSQQTHENNEEDEPSNRFIQFDIGYDQNNESDHTQKFELLKRKKLQDLEKAKIERQRKKICDEEQYSEQEVNTPNNRKYTPKKDRSPLMPSAQLRNKKLESVEQFKPVVNQNNQQKQQKYPDKGNIFNDNYTHDNPSPLPPKQMKVQVQEEIFGQRQNQRQGPQINQQVQDRPASGKVITENRSRNNSTNKTNNRLDTSQNNINQALVGKAKKNNRQILKNAIMNVCLAGEPNKKERESIITQLECVEADHYVILLKGQFGRMDFKALYGMNSQDQVPELLFQAHKSPSVLDPSQVLTYLKYDSGAKEFKPISGNKSFSYIVDAVKLKK